MSDPHKPGALPPDLPPEYAEAYRRGYERAFLEASGQLPEQREPAQRGEPEPDPEPEVESELAPEREPDEEPEPDLATQLLGEPGPEPDPEPEPEHQHEPEHEHVTVRGWLFADDAWDDSEAEPTRVIPVGAVPPEPEPVRHEPEPEPAPEPDPGFDSGPIWLGSSQDAEDYAPTHAEQPRPRRPGWFVPVLLGGLVLGLILGAYLVGRVLSSSVGDTESSTEEPESVEMGDGAGDAGQGGSGGSGDGGKPAADAYQGAVEVAPIGGATASCQAPSSVDAAGNEVGYPPTSAYDGDLTTAWRCNGKGVGQTLSLTFVEPVEVGELALVPGYAKTDPRSGVDRYAENNRITRVRWTFPDGTSVVQKLDGAPANRSLQAMRIAPVQADSVTMEVLASVRGPRNTIAVSEVQIGRVAG